MSPKYGFLSDRTEQRKPYLGPGVLEHNSVEKRKSNLIFLVKGVLFHFNFKGKLGFLGLAVGIDTFLLVFLRIYLFPLTGPGMHTHIHTEEAFRTFTQRSLHSLSG